MYSLETIQELEETFRSQLAKVQKEIQKRDQIIEIAKNLIKEGELQIASCCQNPSVEFCLHCSNHCKLKYDLKLILGHGVKSCEELK
jgi:hypothetical protein